MFRGMAACHLPNLPCVLVLWGSQGSPGSSLECKALPTPDLKPWGDEQSVGQVSRWWEVAGESPGLWGASHLREMTTWEGKEKKVWGLFKSEKVELWVGNWLVGWVMRWTLQPPPLSLSWHRSERCWAGHGVLPSSRVSRVAQEAHFHLAGNFFSPDPWLGGSRRGSAEAFMGHWGLL